MRKYICFFLIFLLLIPAVTADGVAITEDDTDRWNLRPELRQLAAINYENGYENLLIAVSFDETIRGNRTVWLFPVPARPEQVEIDVLKGYPRFGGKELDREVRKTLVFVSAVSASYGAFPASLPTYIMAGAGFFTTQKALETGVTAGDVTVYGHIEKMGLVTELVTAHDATALRHYVAGKGFVLPADAETALDGYSGRDYSFVISYVSNATESGAASRPDEEIRSSSDPDLVGVFVRFPADRIYFPLRPTSVYGNRTIPVLIFVNGFVKPAPEEAIRPATEVSYFIDGEYWYHYSEGELGKFFNYPKAFPPVRYTKIEITAPSQAFTGDLWMDPAPPADVMVKDALVRYPLLWGIPFFVLVSMLSGLVAGSVAFGTNPAYRRPLAMHGLWNCATMIGFACATAEYLKMPEATPRRKLGFFVVFYLLFIAICAASIAVAEPSWITPMTWIAEFFLMIPVAGFLWGFHFFPVSPVLSILAIGLNAAVYIALWRAAKKYLE